MAAAIRSGLSLAGVLMVTDELYTGKWKHMFNPSEVVKAVEKVGQAVANAARAISMGKAL